MPTKTIFVLARQVGDVNDELVGDGVRVVRLSDQTREQIFEQNNLRVAKWELFDTGYDHAITNDFDPAAKRIEEAEQEIQRAIVILRIIQPSTLGMHLVGTVEETEDGTRFFLVSQIGSISASYVGKNYTEGRITRQHIRRAKVLWPNIQLVCQRWNKHTRILQAVRYFEAGCNSYNGEIRHILFHSALECLVCTNRDYLGQQVRQRVIAICPQVALNDVKAITEMRGGLVHSGEIVTAAKGRENELIEKLERILRACLYHALADRESVEIFSDAEKIKKAFPVAVMEAKRIETGRKIFV